MPLKDTDAFLSDSIVAWQRMIVATGLAPK